MDREARLSRAPARFRAAYLAALLQLGLAACATSPANLRLEDVPAANAVRIANPDRRAVRIHYWHERGPADPRLMFEIRYRDRHGQAVAVDYPTVDGWFMGGMYSENAYPVGQVPTQPLTIAGRGSLDFPRDALLERFGQLEHQRPPPAVPCTVQLRIRFFRRSHDHDQMEISGPWNPGPCPRVAQPAP